MDTGKRLLSSSLLRTVNFVLQVAVAFAMTPIIVHSLDVRMYGFWTLVSTFVGYYGLLDLGIHTAVTRYVSRALGQGDVEEANRVASTSFVIFSAVGGLALVLSVAAYVGCPALISDPEEAALMSIIVLILGIRMSLSFPVRVFSGILSAQLRYDLSSFAAILRLIVANALIYWYLKSGHGILALSVITLGAGLLEYILLVVFAYTAMPGLMIRPRRYDPAMTRQILSYSWKSFIIQASNTLRFRFHSFIIASFKTVNLVTYYSIGARLLEYFMQMIFSAIGNLSPVFSRYEGEGDQEKMQARFLTLTRISIIVTVFIGASLMFYGKHFIERWMGPGYEQSYTIILILAVPYTIDLMQTPSIGLLYGTSKHHLIAVMSVCEGLLNVVLAVVLVQYFGIYGVAWAAAIEMVGLKLTLQPVFTCRAAGIPLGRYYLRTLIGDTAKTALPLCVYFWLVRSWLTPDYARIALLGSVQGVLFAPVALFIILDRNERALVLAAISRLPGFSRSQHR